MACTLRISIIIHIFIMSINIISWNRRGVRTDFLDSILKKSFAYVDQIFFAILNPVLLELVQMILIITRLGLRNFAAY